MMNAAGAWHQNPPSRTLQGNVSSFYSQEIAGFVEKTRFTISCSLCAVHCSLFTVHPFTFPRPSSLSLASGICLRYHSSHSKKYVNLGAATTCPKRIRVRRRLSVIRYAEQFSVSRSGYQLSTISYQFCPRSAAGTEPSATKMRIK